MKRATIALCAGSALLLSTAARAHSVAQVQTAKRISQATVVALDPQGNPTPGGMGTDTKAKVGDVLWMAVQRPWTDDPEGMVKLNGSAGEIMKRCDGQRSVGEIPGLATANGNATPAGRIAIGPGMPRIDPGGSVCCIFGLPEGPDGSCGAGMANIVAC